MFRITVEEIVDEETERVAGGGKIKRYEQTVDKIDLGKLAAFINSAPKKRRAKEKTTA